MLQWIKQKLIGSPPAPQEPDVPLDLSLIPGAIYHGDDLPRPNWQVIRAAIDTLPPSIPRSAAWAEAERQWLDELCEALGPPCVWVESGPVLMVTAVAPADAGPFARMAAGALSVIDELIGQPAAPLLGKLVVLALCPAEIYYTYIAHYYQDGEYGGSGGACLSKDGHVHIAFIHAGHDAEAVLAHEMVHVRLRGADIPLWLEEGIAERLSRRVAGSQPLRLEPTEIRRQQHWWHKRGLHSFWDGTSFSRNDRGQAFSYALAEVLVNTMVAEYGTAFQRFLKDARPEDAGDAAARAHFGCGIADLAAAFLGDGDRSFTPGEPESGADSQA